MIRWLSQQNIVAVVKAKSPENLTANLECFDFKLTEEDFEKIKVLNSRGMRISGDPNDIKY